MPCLSIISTEHNQSYGSSRWCGQSSGNHFVFVGWRILKLNQIKKNMSISVQLRWRLRVLMDKLFLVYATDDCSYWEENPHLKINLEESTCGWRSWSRCWGSTIFIAERISMSPSLTMSTAIFTAPLPVRFPDRHWSIHSLFSWTVNSISYSGKKTNWKKKPIELWTTGNFIQSISHVDHNSDKDSYSMVHLLTFPVPFIAILSCWLNQNSHHHVLVMLLQNLAVLHELLVSFRHAAFHRVQVFWCSYSSYNVLSLS